LGIEPVNASNIEAADDAKLRLRHGLEALDCIFFITAIFFSAGHVETPYSPPESPVSWFHTLFHPAVFNQSLTAPLCQI
jgi:hypothetical protein